MSDYELGKACRPIINGIERTLATKIRSEGEQQAILERVTNWHANGAEPPSVDIVAVALIVRICEWAEARREWDYRLARAALRDAGAIVEAIGRLV